MCTEKWHFVLKDWLVFVVIMLIVFRFKLKDWREHVTQKWWIFLQSDWMPLEADLTANRDRSAGGGKCQAQIHAVQNKLILVHRQMEKVDAGKLQPHQSVGLPASAATYSLCFD